MQILTARQIQRDFHNVLVSLSAKKPIAITYYGKIIAYLKPKHQPRQNKTRTTIPAQKQLLYLRKKYAKASTKKNYKYQLRQVLKSKYKIK